VIRQFSVTTNRTERLLWSTEGIKFIPGEEQLLPQEARKRKRNAAIKTESHLGYLRHSWLPRIPPTPSSAPHYYLATTTTITVCVIPNVVAVVWVAALFRVWKVLGFNLGPETCCLEFFVVFIQSTLSMSGGTSN